MSIYQILAAPTQVPQSNEAVLLTPSSEVYFYSQQVCRNPTPLEAKTLAYPTGSLQERLRTAFKHATETVTTPNWVEWYLTNQVTAILHPIDYLGALVKSFVQYIWNEITGLLSFLGDILISVGKSRLCIDGAVSGWLSLEDIASGELCEPIRDIVKLGMSIRERLETFRAKFQRLGAEDTADPGAIEILFDLLSNLGLEVLADILDLIGDEAPDFQQWLHSIAHDASKLGRFWGTILAVIVVEVGTAGLNRGAKAAKAAEKVIEMTLEAAESIEKVREMEKRAELLKAAEKGEDMAFLSHLGELVTKAFTRARLRMNYHIATKKLDVARKILQEILMLDDMPRLVQKLQEQVLKSGRQLRLKIEPYKELRVQTRAHNKDVITLKYAETIQQAEAIDPVQETFSLAGQVLDANHIIEKRVYEKFEHLSIEFKKLGWNSADDMDAVALFHDEHIRSYEIMLEMLGVNTSEIPEFMGETQNVTRVLKQKIIIGGDFTPGPGVFVITEKTTALEVIEAYEKIYRDNFSEIFVALKDKFADWKPKLKSP